MKTHFSHKQYPDMPRCVFTATCNIRPYPNEICIIFARLPRQGYYRRHLKFAQVFIHYFFVYRFLGVETTESSLRRVCRCRYHRRSASILGAHNLRIPTAFHVPRQCLPCRYFHQIFVSLLRNYFNRGRIN